MPVLPIDLVSFLAVHCRHRQISVTLGPDAGPDYDPWPSLHRWKLNLPTVERPSAMAVTAVPNAVQPFQLPTLPNCWPVPETYRGAVSEPVGG